MRVWNSLGHYGSMYWMAAIPMCITSLEGWWLLKVTELELNHYRSTRSRICTLSMILWTVFDSFPNTLATQHAKYKWCAKRPAVCSQYTPHIDYNWVNNSQSGVHSSILIHGKLFSHFLLLLNTTLQYVKTYPTLCGQKYLFYFYTDFAKKLYDF